MPLVSIGTPASRWLTIVTSATASAPSSGSASSPSGNVGAEADVRTVLREQQRRVGSERLGGGHDRGQRVVVDDHGLGRVDRLRLRLGDDRGDDVADEAHLVGGEDGRFSVGGIIGKPWRRREPEVVAAQRGTPRPRRASTPPRSTSTDATLAWAIGRAHERDVEPCPARRGRRRTCRSPVSSVGSSRRRTALPRIEPDVAM